MISFFQKTSLEDIKLILNSIKSFVSNHINYQFNLMKKSFIPPTEAFEICHYTKLFRRLQKETQMTIFLKIKEFEAINRRRTPK